jgi:hypothetical protein
MQIRRVRNCGALLVVLAAIAAVTGHAWGHCDSLEGPVVEDARVALEKGDPAPVLKWVTKEQEGTIRDAFKRHYGSREGR